MEIFTLIILVLSFILILTFATNLGTPRGSGYEDLIAQILHRISSWRELSCNFCFLTSVRYTQSSLKGCSRLASRIFLITRTLLGGLFHVNRWLAGSWMCLGDKNTPRSGRCQHTWVWHLPDLEKYILQCGDSPTHQGKAIIPTAGMVLRERQ